MADDHQQVIQTLVVERDELKGHCLRMKESLDRIGFPPGHFYSPLVDEKNVQASQAVAGRLSAPVPRGIDLDPTRLSSMIDRLAKHYSKFSFPRHVDPGYRFHFENPFFGCQDACTLFAVLLEF